MKYVLIYAFFLNLTLHAQSVQFTLQTAPQYVLDGSQTAKGSPAWGFSTSIEGFYQWTPHFSIGSALTFAQEAFASESEFDGLAIPGANPRYERKLTVQSILIPLNLRFNMISGWYLTVGGGVAFTFANNPSVDFEVNVDPDNVITSEQIPDKDIRVTNEMDRFVNARFGRRVILYDIRFQLDVFYVHRFGEVDVTHVSTVDPSRSISDQFQSRSIGLNIGVGLRFAPLISALRRMDLRICQKRFGRPVSAGQPVLNSAREWIRMV